MRCSRTVAISLLKCCHMFLRLSSDKTARTAQVSSGVSPVGPHGRLSRLARRRAVREIVARPEVAAIRLIGNVRGQLLERAVGTLTAAIVLGTVRRRVQSENLPAEQEALRQVGAERRTVVTFHDQRRTVLLKQIGQCFHHGRRVLTRHRQPEQLLSTRQVVHVQDRRQDAVDQVEGMSEIHRPRAASAEPLQPTPFLDMLLEPLGTIFRFELSQFGARDIGILGLETR